VLHSLSKCRLGAFLVRLRGPRRVAADQLEQRFRLTKHLVKRNDLDILQTASKQLERLMFGVVVKLIRVASNDDA
jgi:hypothetical protein